MQRQGAAACVSFIGHAETPQETQLAFDSARMGLTPGRAYSAWLFDLKDSREHEGRLTERDQRLAYEDCNWADETVVAASFLGARRAVFNIGGNKYRLVVDVRYDLGRVYVRDILTHADYDRRSMDDSL